ncbi:MAG: aldo/keto reductase [Candidatus Hydrogenedentes bacterium]|nr:aldo/keto reductase [Candidatus Hydrogenedentota bacterium]
MQYGTVSGVTKPVSRLVQGTVMVGSAEPDMYMPLLDDVFEQGCNTFDTAHIYNGGENERGVGRWVNSRGIRDKVVIIGKGAHHNPDRKRVTPYDITADICDSLARFKFDYIDLYLLHRDDPSVPVGPIVETLNEHMKAGRIHAFGGSNWSAARVREANTYAAEHGPTPFVASSPQFSLVEMIQEPWEGCISIGGPKSVSDRAWYREQGLHLFTWSALAGGFLSGRLTRANASEHAETLYHQSYMSPANLDRLDRAFELAKKKGITVPQLALAWLLNQPLNLFPLVAAYSGEEFRMLSKALEIKLTEEELAWLEGSA